MITKFSMIKNLAVFQNFTWNNEMRDEGNNVIQFKLLNILYGRNYSGKTTLSRMLRALETGNISDKYENPEFNVSFDDSNDSTHKDLTSHGKKIRVFNRDFIKENLKFISNPDESIVPFAILGGNTKLEDEIRILKEQLGTNDESKETGFYLEFKSANELAAAASLEFRKESTKLDTLLSEKATNKQIGIKYKAEKYGDQNYTKPKLENDIIQVLSKEFVPITDKEQSEYIKVIEEKANSEIPVIKKIQTAFNSLMTETEKLVTKDVIQSDKIQQLVKDSILNRWVKEGRSLHKDKLETCAFCGNKISLERWKELDKHFDEESERLEKEIDALLVKISLEKENVVKSLVFNKNLFYSKFHDKLDRLIIIHQTIIENISKNLKDLELQLFKRKDDLINSQKYIIVKDTSKRLEWCYTIYENLRREANEYSNALEGDQKLAKKLLRLREVSDFVKTIHYEETVANITELKRKSDEANLNKDNIDLKIKKQIETIQDQIRLMNDEEKGALKVNEYLNNYFGHEFLTLQALKETDQLDGKKKIKFEIIRNCKKAHNLSEGECSLIAFCYFMAKLEDIETKGSKPIIWIDDPISSLDGNHIFFVYSMINSEIVVKNNFEQLFISTHNLDFLKYLKRLPGALNKNSSGFFIITCDGSKSTIKEMPRYLKDYVTEFNFLFHQIYLCANADSNDQNQHHLFYNFSNNTRKFLEAFLFYKYPNAVQHDDKLKRFFGNDSLASSMTDRINNEFSHLEGLFERSMLPIDVPEMKKTANFLLQKIEQKDKEQYDALLKSIGIS